MYANLHMCVFWIPPVPLYNSSFNQQCSVAVFAWNHSPGAQQGWPPVCSLTNNSSVRLTQVHKLEWECTHLRHEYIWKQLQLLLCFHLLIQQHINYALFRAMTEHMEFITSSQTLPFLQQTLICVRLGVQEAVSNTHTHTHTAYKHTHLLKPNCYLDLSSLCSVLSKIVLYLFEQQSFTL